jgi:hypothetical protein
MLPSRSSTPVRLRAGPTVKNSPTPGSGYIGCAVLRQGKVVHYETAAPCLDPRALIPKFTRVAKGPR